MVWKKNGKILCENCYYDRKKIFRPCAKHKEEIRVLHQIRDKDRFMKEFYS